ncbi:MAG: hypothetical protein AMS21_05750 [Gemmatimonas sp. SG8_38_2]|nr:MAG: hypothetical protein AMS21_05750 [Gemmatimonas sp. SG8_38_2]
MSERNTKQPRISLAAKILIGMALGVLVGLFFGELVAPVTVVGEAFIMLLQMAVLPYVLLSLIASIGALEARQMARLAVRAGAVMVVLWILTLIVVVLMPLTFPNWQSASFFSSTLVEERPPFDFLALYIPTNPFRALSDNVVPAVVVFSIALGVALSRASNREAVIATLGPLVEALGSITNFVVRLAPVGVFALVAGLAGTMRPEDLKRLEVFLWSYGVMALLLSLWILPGLVTALTPLTYRQVIRESKDALVTAFATGNLFVVLPILAERSKRMLSELTPEGDEAVDVIVPTSFSFPSSGKLLTLSFVLFAGWFSGFEVSLSQYPLFVMAGTFSFFGSTVTAIPFMLDLMQIPADLLKLFLPIDNIITNRFGVLLAAVFILALALLGTGAATNLLTFKLRRLARYAVVTIGLAALAVGGLRFGLGLMEHEYTRDRELVRMYVSRSPVPAQLYRGSVPEPPPNDPAMSRLENIRARGFIRVGYLRDHLPFAFINERAELVGFDVEIAHNLAGDLGVSLEFVLVEEHNVPGHLQRGDIDILMTGTAVTLDAVGQVGFTVPYQDETLAFMVRDHRRSEFTDLEALRRAESLRVGIVRDRYYRTRVQELLPNAEIVTLATPRAFFRETVEGLDALAYTAEAGSAWSVIYPEFAVAVPRPVPLRIPIAYVVPLGDQEFLNFLNTWIALKKMDGTFESAFRYWIMGRGVDETRAPRWSVARDVLGWLD